jgi:hypothetical protein
MTTKKTSTKKVSKKTTKAASAPRQKVEISPTTKLRFAHARKSGGVKTEFLGLMPKKGTITAAKLQKLGSTELKVPAARSSRWLPKFVRRGLVQISAH